MPTIKKFEELEIWRISRELNKEIIKITNQDCFRNDLRFKSQIRSAAGSVMDNIAEGFEREGNAEFKQALSIGKGSAGEVRSQLYRAYDSSFIEENEFTELKHQYEILSVKLKNFIEYLKNSDFKGNKFKK